MKIRVESIPSGAWIFFDGSNIEHQTNFTLTNINPGLHTVRVTHDGYRDAQQQVTVVSDETALVLFTLVPQVAGTVIEQNATLFIGEEGLNITHALDTANAQSGVPSSITTIGWWPSAGDIHRAPAVSADLAGREHLFEVNQSEFDGYEGEWYLVDENEYNHAKAGTDAVFKALAPKLDLQIHDSLASDVTGQSVERGSQTQFPHSDQHVSGS